MTLALQQTNKQTEQTNNSGTEAQWDGVGQLIYNLLLFAVKAV